MQRGRTPYYVPNANRIFTIIIGIFLLVICGWILREIAQESKVDSLEPVLASISKLADSVTAASDDDLYERPGIDDVTSLPTFLPSVALSDDIYEKNDTSK
jgi:hypothetical protein